MAAIADAVTHCRFEATDNDSDEVRALLLLLLVIVIVIVQHEALLGTKRCSNSIALALITHVVLTDTWLQVVLFKILRVLLESLRCPAGGLLSDHAVCDMLQTCFRMSVQLRLSGACAFSSRRHHRFA